MAVAAISLSLHPKVMLAILLVLQIAWLGVLGIRTLGVAGWIFPYEIG
jgi:hypothetical protein